MQVSAERTNLQTPQTMIVIRSQASLRKLQPLYAFSAVAVKRLRCCMVHLNVLGSAACVIPRDQRCRQARRSVAVPRHLIS